MPIYNVIEYSKNYSKTFGTLWKYTRDIPADPITNSGSFKYKTSIIENRFKQTNWTRKPDLKQQINFISKLEWTEGATIFYFIKKSGETTFEFSQNSVSII